MHATTRPPRPSLDAQATFPRHVHLLGAGGAGVSGLGRILVARGVRVSGHDRGRSTTLDGLAELDLHITLGDSRAELLPALCTMLREKFGIAHSTIQVEPEGFDQSARCDAVHVHAH